MTYKLSLYYIAMHIKVKQTSLIDDFV